MPTDYSQRPQYLWLLMLTYTVCLLMANWYDARLIAVGRFVTDAGTIIFPITFLASDLITEVYGYKNTRRAIGVGFAFNVLALLYGQLIIHLPRPSYAPYNDVFKQLLDINFRIVIASICSYFTSEPLNAYLVAKLKIKTAGRMMWLRFVLSTVLSAGLDSFIFSFVAFYGAMSAEHCALLAVTMWGFKVAIEILGLPVSLTLARKLKRAEGWDIYDRQTVFSLFRWNAKY